jgi:hypothetical protein
VKRPLRPAACYSDRVLRLGSSPLACLLALVLAFIGASGHQATGRGTTVDGGPSSLRETLPAGATPFLQRAPQLRNGFVRVGQGVLSLPIFASVHVPALRPSLTASSTSSDSRRLPPARESSGSARTSRGPPRPA